MPTNSPSVGPGNILGDLIAAPPACVTRLDTIFRQGETSGIIRTAHAIRAGETHPDKTLQSLRELQPEDDFVFIEASSPEQTAKAIRYLATEYIPKTHHSTPFANYKFFRPYTAP